MASLLGINVDRTISLTFVMGAALAAVAGVMYLVQYNVVNFADGFVPGVKAFTAAVLGGIGSLPGAVLGGILIGLISWIQATILAYPLSRLLSDQVGLAFTDAPLSFAFSVQGIVIWLAIVTIVAALASYLPARNASRLTVREVLAYE